MANDNEASLRQSRLKLHVVSETNLVRTEEAVEDTCSFNILYLLNHLIGAAIVVIVIYWIQKYLGGFSEEFSWHILLMVLGIVYLQANAILVYRALRNLKKPQLKSLHAFLLFAGLITAIVGSGVIIDIKIKKSHLHLQSLHSWIGLTAVLLFILQWVVGFVTYLYPQAAYSFRAKVMPVHIFFGVTSFLCGITASLLGLAELSRGEQLYLVNSIGILEIIFAGLVGFLVTTKKYKRMTRPHD